MPTINGTSGADSLIGTSGDDILIGGAGNDTLNGAGGTDTVDYLSSPNGVTVNLATGTAQDGFGGTDTLISIEHVGGTDLNDVIVGNAGDNYLGAREGADSVDGGDGNDILAGGGGDDTLFGGAGNDLLQPGFGRDMLNGGDGFDTVDYSDLSFAIQVDLYSGTFEDTFEPGTIENIFGSAQNDTLLGDYRDNILKGAGGSDTLNGREGIDIALFTGNRADYQVTASGSGWTVRDLRGGAPDGTDSISNIEILRFADQDFTLGAGGGGGAQVNATVATAISNILRINGANSSLGIDLTTQINAGMSMQLAMDAIVVAARATTSVATLSYEFFTGRIPSLGGIDYLVSPTGPNANNINSNYYQSFGLENRYINFAVNLGLAGDGRANFQAQYGALDLFRATAKAYETIFGGAPSDAKVHALLDPTTVLNGVSYTRAEYFAYYGQDGANGLGTKAAMVGWLLSEAVKADLGTYAKVNDAFLLDLTDGANFAVDIVGVYNQPGYAYYPS